MNNVPVNERLRAEIQAEINSNRVNIDFSCFSKTKAEQQMVNALKLNHKQALIKAGYNPKKQMNLPAS